jgi:hypothetical protein
LQRIAASLDALASLAVRLGTVPLLLPLRLLVLWAFRHGEAAARAFVIDTTLAFGRQLLLPVPAPAAASMRDSIAEAARLAASFVALAKVLRAIAEAESRALYPTSNEFSAGARGLRHRHQFGALPRALHDAAGAADLATLTALAAAPDTS